MSITQWKAIYDRLAALEAKVAELEAAADSGKYVYQTLKVEGSIDFPPVQQAMKRGPGRPRKVTNG